MAVKKYLDETGLTEVAAHVNTRLKTVTTMPVTADEGAIRMYCGETTSNFIKGHTYQMRATLEQRLQFSADTTTYFMTQDGTITDVAPTSYSPQIEGIPVTDPETGAELVYMAGNNALVQRLGSDVNTITVDFNKIKSSVMPWWTAGAATGSYNPYTIRNVKLVSITEWVDITPSGSILSVGSVNDLLTAWTQMNNDSTAVVNVTTTFALNADYNIPTGRHFLLKGSDADKTTLWTNDGRIFSATLEASALVWTELHDDSKLSKVDELPSNPSVGDTVLFNGETGTETEGHIYKYKDLTEHFTGAEVDGTYYDMNGDEIATPTDPEYSTSITVSAGGYELYVDDTAGKLFAKKTSDDSTYSVTMNDDGTFTVGDAYVPESSVAAVAGNIATWSVENFDWVDLEDDFKKTFIGTQAEWDSLSLNTKKAFDIVQITDDFTGGVITVNTVQEGNLNPVTSNAVAVALNTNYQKKDLTDPLTIGGAEKTTVEDALAGLNNLIPPVTRPTTNPLVSKNEIVFKLNKTYFEGTTVDDVIKLLLADIYTVNEPVKTGNYTYTGTLVRGGAWAGEYVVSTFNNTNNQGHIVIQNGDGAYNGTYTFTVYYSGGQPVYHIEKLVTASENNFKYQIITTDSDLNSINTSGAYSIYISDPTSQATNHAPTYGWLQLIVIQMNNSQSFCNQILYDADGKMFIRECGNTTWSDWKQVGNDLTSGTITIPAQTLENGAHAEIQIPLTPGDFYCGRIDFSDLPSANMSLSYNDFSGSFQDTRSTEQRTQYVLYPIGKANLATLHVYLTNYTGSPVAISDINVIYYLEHHKAQ